MGARDDRERERERERADAYRERENTFYGIGGIARIPALTAWYSLYLLY